MTSSMTRLAKILAVAFLTGCTVQETKEPADLVLRNGKVRHGRRSTPRGGKPWR